jgi:ribonuclease P protein component
VTNTGSLWLRPQNRIRKAKEFQECKENGRRVFSKNIICQFQKTPLQYPRIGLIVTRRTGSSVIRNRWKRILREFFRTHPENFKSAVDYVFVVKSTTQNVPPDDIRTELSKLMEKVKIS